MKVKFPALKKQAGDFRSIPPAGENCKMQSPEDRSEVVNEF
jgi:hypothetical protein